MRASEANREASGAGEDARSASDQQAPQRPAAAEPPRPHPHASTRLLGGGYLVLGLLALYLLARRAFELDFGTENPRVLTAVRLTSVVVPAYPALLGLIALLTGRRPGDLVNPFGLPFEGWWFSTLGAMTWRELKRFFFHPVAYVVMGAFLTINGGVIRSVLDSYAGTQSFRDLPLPASYWITVFPLLWISLAVLLPAVTMRLLAEEQRLGTLEMLLTAPVTDTQVVLSKYLAAFSFFLSMVVVTFTYQFIIKSYSAEWDWGPVFVGYLGLTLGGGVFLAVGLFFSSLTRSQILAYVFTVLPLLLLVIFVPWWSSMATSTEVPDAVRAVLRSIDVTQHQREMARGILSWSNVTFYVSVTVYLLFLAVRGVESHRWR